MTTEENSSVQAPEGGEPEVTSGFAEVDFSDLMDFNDGKEPETEEAVATDDEQETEEVVADSEEQDQVSAEAESEEAEDESSKESPEETPETQAQAEEQPTESETTEEVPESVKMPTKEELQGMYDDFRKESLPALEKLYEMDEDMVTAFEENPTQVLPKLAAQMHFDSMMSSYNAVMAALPSVVGRYLHVAGQAQVAEQQFYDEWPELKQVKPQDVRLAIRSYRQANPKAKLEDVIKGAGTLAAINAGIDVAKRGQQSVESKPVAPKRRPAKPAGSSGSNPTPPPSPNKKPESNEFADLVEAWNNSQFG